MSDSELELFLLGRLARQRCDEIEVRLSADGQLRRRYVAIVKANACERKECATAGVKTPSAGTSKVDGRSRAPAIGRVAVAGLMVLAVTAIVTNWPWRGTRDDSSTQDVANPTDPSIDATAVAEDAAIPDQSQDPFLRQLQRMDDGALRHWLSSAWRTAPVATWEYVFQRCAERSIVEAIPNAAMTAIIEIGSWSDQRSAQYRAARRYLTSFSRQQVVSFLTDAKFEGLSQDQRQQLASRILSLPHNAWIPESKP